MKENDNEGRLVFKDGKLTLINTKEPVLQVARELIVLRKPIYKN
jgi:hypothetical protein